MMAKDYDGLTASSILETADFHAYSRTTSLSNDSESGDSKGSVSDGSIWKSDETISVPNAKTEDVVETIAQTKSSIVETGETKTLEFVPELAIKTTTTTTTTTTTKFYLLPMPETTTWLLGNFTEEAVKYYETNLNEDQAEV